MSNTQVQTANIWIGLGLIGLVVVVLVACTGGQPEATSQRVLDIGMLMAQGGLGDRSFNDSAYSGLQEAQRNYAIRFETADYTSDDANIEKLREFAREGYDLVIGVGYENAGYIQTVAAEYPDIPFAIIDATAEGDNVASVIYREQEGDFSDGSSCRQPHQDEKGGVHRGHGHRHYPAY